MCLLGVTGYVDPYELFDCAHVSRIRVVDLKASLWVSNVLKPKARTNKIFHDLPLCTGILGWSLEVAR